MRIAIVGAGAIGGWLGVRLARSGHDVSVLARGETLAAIKRDGLVLTSGEKTFAARVTASNSGHDLGAQNLVVVAVKGPALGAAAPLVAAMLGPETVVLPAMNGVPWWFTTGLPGPIAEAPLATIDPEGAIARAIPSAHIIGCVVHASSSVSAPGHIAHKMGNGLIVGEPSGAMTERLSRIGGALKDAGFDVSQSQRIQQDIWYKLWGNMTMNPISALTGATADRILDDPLVASFTLAVMAEAAEIGRRIGCPISESGEDRMKVTRKLGAFKTSMLQDAEAGRPLEIDQLVAAPHEIAKLVGVPTPNLDTLLGLVRLYARTRRLY